MAHLLKRLELNGFKSFAQKTILEFPAGITAIVGPNGSGKSNVVDAIRWLLGERDAKSLRGGKIEDLIFSGTQKRPRLGQAQASLYFENNSKFFPVEFTEVSVMREVRRDGESRYFLNKSEVLLRDLVDFFAKVRLGSRGLVVMTQGNSDVFIRATPSGRREMIEEILGLREYQIKKDEAERRLKNTEINLEKIRALVEEISPHLRSLKRQTSRWERRAEFEKELRELENQFFGYQWQELHDKIMKLDHEIKEHGKELEKLTKDRETAEERQKSVEASEPKERALLKGIKERTQMLLEERSRLEKDMGRLEAHIEMSKTQTPTTASNSARALSLVKELRERLKAALEETPENRERMMKAMIEDINELLEDSQNEKPIPSNALARDFEALKKEIQKLEGNLQGLKEEEKKLEKNQEHFYEFFREAVKAVEKAKDEIEAWQNKNQERVFEKERLELRREELERQMHQAGRNPEEFESHKRGDTPPDFSATEKRIFKLRGDLASIGEIDEALVKEAQETETRYDFLKREAEDLEKAQTDLRGLIRELNEKIRTEFTHALEGINKEFSTLFHLMFGGGQAKLKVQVPKKVVKVKEKGEREAELENEAVEGEEMEEGGIDIEIKLPRQKVSSLEMLSGGERSLVGIAALFALISVSPPPFLVLDEIDAALDDRNARRFAEMLAEFSKKTQFLVVTHNRATMEAAHVLYGVTLSEDGTSKILSLKLESSSA